MKELFAGVVILFVVGVGAFLYRNTMERPGVTLPEVMCSTEAKICPDGSSVGRAGLSCAFAPCAFPNGEVSDAGIAFVVPEGYVMDEAVRGIDPSLRTTLTKPSGEGLSRHTITVRSYPILEGQTADEVILAHTVYQPAGEQATDFSRFRDLVDSNRTFKETTIERFEGIVHSAYFLPREHDVLVFEITEQGVMNWTEPSLSIRSLPEHTALLELLRTLQVTK